MVVFEHCFPPRELEQNSEFDAVIIPGRRIPVSAHAGDFAVLWVIGQELRNKGLKPGGKTGCSLV